MSTGHTHPHTQRGYTLPELLIGMALGLFVIAAATAAYGTSKQSWNTMAAADAVHANARFALRNIREQAQMSGAAYLTENSTQGQFAVELSPSENVGQAALSGMNGTQYLESITLGHWDALDAIDCQGNTGSTHLSVRSDYKLNTHKELSCKDLNLTGSTYQALAEGVEDFQVRYAEADPNSQTIQWKTADQVHDMTRVLAFEVCLRLASLQKVYNAQPNPSLHGCQDDVLQSDGRVRRTFKQVIAMRNRNGVMP